MKFKISSELKNVIGKDLISNDFIAIFELVKNSYDAHANKVKIIFREDKIIIEDDGKGMDEEDLVNKWLFVAYSAKKNGEEDKELEDDKYRDYREKLSFRRGFAGAKGIGRFSCDRLGSKLKLTTRKVHTNKIEQINVDWEKFEEDSTKEFINIDVEHSNPKETSIKNFEHGTILEITNLRETWPSEKIDKLKTSLEKLINPFSSDDDFKIEVQRGINSEPVENNIVKLLTFKTTKLDVKVEKKFIYTTLSDRGTLIYKTKTPNKFKHIKNSSILLFYLNTAAKNNFTRRMGVITKDFGNVLLYNNGFRVYPFGETNDDSLGIDRRYQQGYRRFLGTRNLIGSINLDEYSEQFKEKSSRDGGLLETAGYNELKEMYWEFAHKPLERYVVDIQWPIGDKDNFADDIELLNNIESKSKIIELISKLVDKKDIEVIDFNSDFLNIVQEKTIKPTDEIINKLSALAQAAGNNEILSEIDEARKKLEELEEEKKRLEQQYTEEKERTKDLELEKEKFAEQLKEEQETSKKLFFDNRQKEKQILFYQSERTLSEDELVNLQHHIGINAEIIDGTITNFKREMDKKITITKEEVLEFLDEISLTNQKILAINKYATKADFLTNSETITEDIVSFVQQYIENIYNIISTGRLQVKVDQTTLLEYVMNFKPMEMTIVIDNLLNNARKARATLMEITFEQTNSSFEILFTDNGTGLDPSIKNIDTIFEKGITTTKGSGLGLYHIKKIMTGLNGDIEVNSNKGRGVTMKLRFEK